jgi:hypothetical protein
MAFVLLDKPCLPDHERSARSVGQVAGFGGGAVGVGVAVYLVGVLGVPGYSAAESRLALSPRWRRSPCLLRS